MILHASNLYVQEALSRDEGKYAAVAALVEGKTAPFRKLVKAKRPDYSPEQVADRVKYYRQLAKAIENGTYSEEAAKAHAEQEGRAYQPILISVDATGHIWFKDGSHRAMVLAALGRPIACETLVDPAWQTVVDWVDQTRIYQPHPHPCFAEMHPIRPGMERYQRVGEWLTRHDAVTVVEVGSSHGSGALEIARHGLHVAGMDSVETNYTLCQSLAELHPDVFLVPCWASTLDSPLEVDAVVGLSVWHHLAADMNAFKWFVDKTCTARIQVVELPEVGSTRWSEKLLQETGQTLETVAAYVLEEIKKAGNYTHTESLGTDPTYGNRETIAMWRD